MAITFVKREEPVAVMDEKPYEGPVVCGGNAPKSKEVHERAVLAAMEELSNHPCGCEVCFANAVLGNLTKFRAQAGLDPGTGNIKE
jgi:hypothetical protein